MDEKSYCQCLKIEKVSRSLKYDSNIFFVHQHIAMDTTVDHFTPLALRVRGNYKHNLFISTA